MMLYLTGSPSSSKSNEAIQDDAAKSLGGYISSSPVPNAAINVLFDLISIKTLQERNKETIAIGLVNKFDYDVSNVSLKIVSDQDNVCKFMVAATTVDQNHCMEHINNRYSEPLNAEFYDATFFKASVDVEILEPGIKGEEIVFDPFNIIANVKESGLEGTFNAITEAFLDSEDYSVKRLTDRTFRIEKKSDDAVDPSIPSYMSTDNSKFKFLGEFKNIKNNEVFITEELKPNEAIGIWIQRIISNVAEKTDEQILLDYNNKLKTDNLESVELVINYSIT